MMGVPTAPNHSIRAQCHRDVFAENPGIKVVAEGIDNDSIEKTAQQQAAAIMQANPNLKGWVASDAAGPIGIGQAIIERASRIRSSSSGWTNLAEMLDLVRSGVADSSSASLPEMQGYWSVMLLWAGDRRPRCRTISIPAAPSSPRTTSTADRWAARGGQRASPRAARPATRRRSEGRNHGLSRDARPHARVSGRQGAVRGRSVDRARTLPHPGRRERRANRRWSRSSRDRTARARAPSGSTAGTRSNTATCSARSPTCRRSCRSFPDVSVAENPLHALRPDGAWRAGEQAPDAGRGAGLSRPFRHRGAARRSRRHISVPDQQLLQIARASTNAEMRVLILDEPTSALTAREVERVFKVIRGFLDRDPHAIVFISHKMEEVFAIGDDYTVLRNGEKVDAGRIADIDEPALIRAMSGREIAMDDHFRPDGPVGEPIMEVSNLSGPMFEDVSFTLRRRGEILGLAGLVGAGRSELMQTVFGFRKARSGSVRVEGKAWRLGDHGGLRRRRDAVSLGRAQAPRHLPASLLAREHRHLRAVADVRPARHRFRKGAQSRRAGSSTTTASAPPAWKAHLATLRRQPAEGDHRAGHGDHAPYPDLRRAHQGIDIRTKAEIYRIMKTLAEEGVGIVLISSEMNELRRCASRIVTPIPAASPAISTPRRPIRKPSWARSSRPAPQRSSRPPRRLAMSTEAARTGEGAAKAPGPDLASDPQPAGGRLRRAAGDLRDLRAGLALLPVGLQHVGDRARSRLRRAHHHRAVLADDPGRTRPVARRHRRPVRHRLRHADCAGGACPRWRRCRSPFSSAWRSASSTGFSSPGSGSIRWS